MWKDHEVKYLERGMHPRRVTHHDRSKARDWDGTGGLNGQVPTKKAASCMLKMELNPRVRFYSHLANGANKREHLAFVFALTVLLGSHGTPHPEALLSRTGSPPLAAKDGSRPAASLRSIKQ